MPDVRNCKRCGRVYNYIGGPPLCPVCRDEDEQEYKRVKEYLYEYPGATMTQVSTELNVSVEKIKRFLKEGRLEIVNDDPNFILQCEMCGKSIKTGRYCNACERELTSGFKKISDSFRPRRDDTPLRDLRIRYMAKDQKGKK